MGQVISLDARRARRACVADLTALHPATRWTSTASPGVAHRRDPASGVTRCGAGGALVVAPRTAPLCPLCGEAA